MPHFETPPVGTVYLVGAGPGDPGLITLRGIECLAFADVVLYDYLVNPRILEHARAEAERVCLGQHGRTRIWTQQEISAMMVQSAISGKTVVRLKGGDPAVFARGAQDTADLARHQIPFEIVPGVTSALAAASYTEVPITHRDHASAVALIVGQEKGAKDVSSLDFSSLASFPGTLMFYMGVTTAPVWTTALIQAGKAASTPALIIRRCTLPDQHTIHCTLGEVSEQITQQALRPPAIVIVGDVTSLAPERSWFERRALFGRRIMVTRPAHQAASLVGLLDRHGAEAILQPAIEIGPPADWAAVDRALATLREFDWLVFSSVNGVRALLDRLATLGHDLRALGSVRLAAIGPGTTRCLRQYHLNVDRQPERFQAEDLARVLASEAVGKRFLLARASRGREVLAEQLQTAGAQVTQVVVYSSVDVQRPIPEVAQFLRKGAIDWITVTSSAIARSLANLFGDQLEQARLASISPITSATLRELGFSVSAEAEQATMQGVVQAMIDVEQSS